MKQLNRAFAIASVLLVSAASAADLDAYIYSTWDRLFIRVVGIETFHKIAVESESITTLGTANEFQFTAAMCRGLYRVVQAEPHLGGIGIVTERTGQDILRDFLLTLKTAPEPFRPELDLHSQGIGPEAASNLAAGRNVLGYSLNDSDKKRSLENYKLMVAEARLKHQDHWFRSRAIIEEDFVLLRAMGAISHARSLLHFADYTRKFGCGALLIATGLDQGEPYVTFPASRASERDRHALGRSPNGF